MDKVILLALVTGISLYVDPSSWGMHLGFYLCSTKKNHFLSLIMGVGITIALMFITGDIHEQLHNVKNILLIKDHSENIGVYYYISIEIFL